MEIHGPNLPRSSATLSRPINPGPVNPTIDTPGEGFKAQISLTGHLSNAFCVMFWKHFGPSLLRSRTKDPYVALLKLDG